MSLTHTAGRVSRLIVLPLIAAYATVRLTRHRRDRRTGAALWAEAVAAGGGSLETTSTTPSSGEPAGSGT